MINYCKKIFGKKAKKIAILPLKGAIGQAGSFKNGLNFSQISAQIDKAFHKSHSLVALIINSPGGSPVQSELIFKKIRQKSLDTNIPVWAFVEDVAASGGYFLALAADKIFASKCSIIGSIGVISSGFGFHQLLEKLGIQRRIYTTGSQKSVLDPFLPENDSDIALIKDLQNDIYQAFTEIVKERRAEKLTLSDEQIFTGKIWSGTKSKEIGLIDEIGDCHCVLTAEFGKDLKLVNFGNDKSFLKRFTSSLTEIFANALDSFVAKLEARAFFSKFGL